MLPKPVEKSRLAIVSEASTASLLFETGLSVAGPSWFPVSRINRKYKNVTKARREKQAVHCIVSYRIVSYRIVSYRIVSYRIVSYCIVSYRIVYYSIV